MSEPNCRQHNQHDTGVEEAVDMQRINQMIDIKDMAPDVEHFQNTSEERDAAQHHVGQVAEQGADKKPHFRSVFAHLFFRPTFDPAFKRRGGFRIVEDDERPISHWTVGLLARRGCRRSAWRLRG